MAKLLVRCMGSASDPNVKYIYKDGVSEELLDNGEYKYVAGYVLDGGFTLNAANMSADVTTNSHCRTIITTSAIDVTNYSTVKCLINNSTTVSLDISSVLGAAYIGISRHRTGSDVNQFAICAASAKNGFADPANRLALNADTVASGAVIVNRIWLEK